MLITQRFEWDALTITCPVCGQVIDLDKTRCKHLLKVSRAWPGSAWFIAWFAKRPRLGAIWLWLLCRFR